MPDKVLSDSQTQQFHRDGYLVIRSLFDHDEADILRKTAKADAAFKKHAYPLNDGEGGTAKLVLWNKAGEDIYGAVAWCHRAVDAMEQLLGGQVYHYHSKMSIKVPHPGGASVRHQGMARGRRTGCSLS